MNHRLIFKFIGYVLLSEAALMLPALFISVFSSETAVVAFLVSIFITAAVGILLSCIKSNTGDMLRAREGFAIVALSWIVISFFGCLPFYFSHAIPSFIDCWFETVSGFTTTGASILTQVESMERGLLYWRSFTHWVGGMGVLVLLLAVIPLSRGNGESFQLMRAESPGPAVGKLTPTLRHTSRMLYGIYCAMTLIEIVLLLFGGMPLFDAVTHAFGTAGTGGFSIKNASIGAYDSTYIQMVIGIFMALFGVNFSIYYLLITRQFRAAFRNEELRMYVGTMLLSSVIIGVNILPLYEKTATAFRDSFFQVSSIMTTTGYATADFNLWPELSRFIMVALMIFGASAGSTGGGLKMARVLILFKHFKNEMHAILHPHSVRTVRMDGKTVESGVVRGTTSFLVAYFIISLASMFIVAFDNFSQETTVTAVISCINNIGPGLDIVGPMGNYSSFSPLSKFVLSIDMLIGRLEIFPMLLLCLPSVWKRNVRGINNSLLKDY